MPRYCFYCPKCKVNLEVVRPMAEADDPWRCLCGKDMQRYFASEGVRTGGKYYNRPIHSDSLAISPTQVEEHKRLFPNIQLDKQCRPVFDKFGPHEDYLRKTGFKKLPCKKKRKCKKIA